MNEPTKIQSKVALKNGKVFTSSEPVEDIEIYIARSKFEKTDFITFNTCKQISSGLLAGTPKKMTLLISEIIYIEEV